MANQHCKSNTLEGRFAHFLDRAKEIHGDNYIYNIKDYINYKTKMKIVCKKHGPFFQMPQGHVVNKNGCPDCKRETLSDKKSLSADDFFDRSKDKYNIFDYSETVYNGLRSEVLIKCFKHGTFSTLASNHLDTKNGGCSGCYLEDIRDSSFMFIKKAQEIHNFKYNYSKVNYINSRTKVCIICATHGEFWQRPRSHIMNQGCPECGAVIHHITSKSKAEQEWLDFLNIPKNKRNKGIKINEYRFNVDGYYNGIVYEFYGDFWHGNPEKFPSGVNPVTGLEFKEMYNKTIEREKVLKKAGLKVISVWESDWRKLNG